MRTHGDHFVGSGVYRLEYTITYPPNTEYEGPTSFEVYQNIVKMDPVMQPETLNKDARCTGQTIVMDMPTCNWTIGVDNESLPVPGYPGSRLYLKSTTGTTFLSNNVYTPSSMQPGVREQFLFQFDSATPIPAGAYNGFLVPAHITDKAQIGDSVPEVPYFMRAHNILWVTAEAGEQSAGIQADVSPNPLRLLDADQKSGGMKQADTLTLTVPGWHFTGTPSRFIEILDGDNNVVIAETEVTDVEENPVTGDTTLRYTFSETDLADLTTDIYTVNVYQQGCAAYPVAVGTFAVSNDLYVLHFYHHDHLGTVRSITDKDGTVVSTHEHAAYGEELSEPEFDTNRMKFTGHERDAETNLDYMLARYYGGKYGQFFQMDPFNVAAKLNSCSTENDRRRIASLLEQPMFWNGYSYCFGNPVRFIDEDGELPEDLSISPLDNWGVVKMKAGEFYDGFAYRGNNALANYKHRDNSINWEFALGHTVGTAFKVFGAIGTGRTVARLSSSGWWKSMMKEGDVTTDVPVASNAKLKNVLNDLFRPTDTTPGGTVGKALEELSKGQRIKHLTKLRINRRALMNVLRKQHLSAADRELAEKLLKEVNFAIKYITNQ